MNGRDALKKDFFIILIIYIITISSSCTPLIALSQKTSDNIISDSDYQLVCAIQSHNIEGVKEAIEDGAHLNDLEYGGSKFSQKDRSAIGLALERAEDTYNTVVIRSLVEAGADVNGCVTKYKCPYLLYLAGTREKKLMDLFIDHGADVNTRGKGFYKVSPLTALLSDTMLSRMSGFEKNGEMYLYKSEREDYEHMIHTLLEYGSEVNGKDLKSSLESMARLTSAPIILKALNEKGVSSGLSPALESIILGDSEEAMSTLHTVKKKEQDNMLLFASAFGSKELLSEMTEAGYDFDVEMELQWGTIRPAEIAAAFNDLSSLKYICSVIKDSFNVMPYEENTLLTYAVKAGSENMKWLSGEVGFSVGRQLKKNEAGDKVYDFVAATEAGNFDALKAIKDQELEPSKKEIEYAYSSMILKGNIDYLTRFHEMGYEMPVGSKDGSMTDYLTGENEECISKAIDWGAYISSDTIEEIIEIGSDELFDKAFLGYKGRLNNDMLGDAVETGRLHIIKALLKAGRKAETSYGIDEDVYPTMIHYAAICPSIRVLECLLSACDDPYKIKNMKDNKGRTPYDLAKEVGLKKNMAVLSA